MIQTTEGLSPVIVSVLTQSTERLSHVIVSVLT
jgi:hypothetical protein